VDATSDGAESHPGPKAIRGWPDATHSPESETAEQSTRALGKPLAPRLRRHATPDNRHHLLQRRSYEVS